MALPDDADRPSGDSDDALFAWFDRDGDGFISAAALASLMTSLGERPGPGEIEELLRSVGGESDDEAGRVDRAAFGALLDGIRGGGAEASMREHFASFDTDGDGYITSDELHAALTGLGEEASEAEVRELLARGDLDGDGRLDFEEFVAIMMK